MCEESRSRLNCNGVIRFNQFWKCRVTILAGSIGMNWLIPSHLQDVTEMQFTAVFDNSAENPVNPDPEGDGVLGGSDLGGNGAGYRDSRLFL